MVLVPHNPRRIAYYPWGIIYPSLGTTDLKVQLAEDLMQSSIVEHIFVPTNVREHFPEEDLALGKSRL